LLFLTKQQQSNNSISIAISSANRKQEYK